MIRAREDGTPGLKSGWSSMKPKAEGWEPGLGLPTLICWSVLPLPLFNPGSQPAIYIIVFLWPNIEIWDVPPLVLDLF